MQFYLKRNLERVSFYDPKILKSIFMKEIVFLMWSFMGTTHS